MFSSEVSSRKSIFHNIIQKCLSYRETKRLYREGCRLAVIRPSEQFSPASLLSRFSSLLHRVPSQHFLTEVKGITIKDPIFPTSIGWEQERRQKRLIMESADATNITSDHTKRALDAIERRFALRKESEQHNQRIKERSLRQRK